MQGKQQFVFEMAQFVREFNYKLQSYQTQISKRDFKNFLTLNKYYHDDASFASKRYETRIEKLLTEFNTRFSDFEKYRKAFEFFKNPYNFTILDAEELCPPFNVNEADFQSDLASILSQDPIRSETVKDMWVRLLHEQSFSVLNHVIPRFFSMFASTYSWESTFSCLKYRKSKYRSRLSDCHLENELRCATSTIMPDFRKMISDKNCQQSHWIFVIFHFLFKINTYLYFT